MKVDIVGVGNSLFGDDGIGVEIVKGLGVVAENAPENFITMLDGDVIIFVDAVDIGLEPGTVVLLKNPPLEITTSTHKIPYNIFKKYLEEKGKQMLLLGIQIKSMKEPSKEIKVVGKKIKKILTQVKGGAFEDVQTLYQTVRQLLSEANLSVVSDV